MIKLKHAFIAMFAIIGQFAYSQTSTVSGVVSDESGTPLPGATIVVSGTTNGTTTDFDGNYSLSNVGATDKLEFSYVGMTAKVVAVGNQTNINVTLEEDAQALEEVVVVGYGTQSRAEVTGAITTVGSEEISSLPVATADQALQGRAAGVTVLNSGSPGTAPVVRIRGLGTMNNNDPLYVIDGVIAGGLGDLNPNDIESINVLKDASTTAIYGSLGSNGVVMVTTKKGRRTGKTVINLDSYTGIQYSNQRYDLLNTQEYLQFAQDAFGFTPTSALSQSGNNTDFQDALFRTGVMQKVDLGISGGSENSDFRFSAGYLDQEGAVIETGFERFSFRANSNFTLGKFKFGETLAVSFNKQNPERNLGDRSLLEHAIKIAPYLPIYNPNNLQGFQGPSNGSDGQDAENPIRVQTLGEHVNKSSGIIGSLFGEYEIVEGLSFKSQVGLEYRNSSTNIFRPSYNDDSEGGNTHSSDFAAITRNSGLRKSIILTNSLNYSKTYNDLHNLEFLILAEKQEQSDELLNSNSQNPITNELDQVSNEQSFLESKSYEYNRIGYLARLNYNYDQKYILAASIRRDASSRFGENNRWGTFPSVALGWNIANESFLENSSINTLKLRGSWGITGNDRIEDYRYSATLLSNFFYPLGEGLATGTTPGGLANPDLKWEETTMKNIGLDFGFYDGKITGALEYYNNTSNDLLMDRPLPGSLGIHSGVVTENVGSVETSGFELNIGYNDFEGDFTWSANLNLGTSSNEVQSLGENESLSGGFFEGQNISRVEVGQPLFFFYGYETNGIYQTQGEVEAVLDQVPDDKGEVTYNAGDIRFVDQNGDRKIDDQDRVNIGNPYPDLTYGLNLDFNYKQLDLNMFISGVAGVDVYNTNIYDLEGMPRLFNAGTNVLNRWTGPGTSNSVPQAGGADENFTLISDRFVEDGSYTRLKNITLGYTLENTSLERYFSKCRIYVSGQNLITISDYSGLDPEIGNPLTNDGGSRRYELGIDRGNYPQPKSVLLGVQLSF
ncbi:TonB-dependent receptor [Zobellia galactanivorans]|uniref:SusC/RagA family TonB-linked outer membrane protein n=1 Tax=Zobellia galactanivorans (strain DSM 12802 / CCUG 47099 / CIP 106680 / NCIMB 13871 / Dsij) TaxID=63186 RepID=UPI0026E237A7|nr:TonB-dependent receptor [Zobellia galactanivorans]MDO6807815.1 TonB-dependent receptor [Zobellia galactanivorans]